MLINTYKFINSLVELILWRSSGHIHRHVRTLDAGVAATPSPLLYAPLPLLMHLMIRRHFGRCPCTPGWGPFVLPQFCKPTAGYWLLPKSHGEAALPSLGRNWGAPGTDLVWQLLLPFYCLSPCQKCPCFLHTSYKTDLFRCVCHFLVAV